MPIVVDAATVTTTTAAADSGQISFLRAKQLVARGIGDTADQNLLDEAGDLILMAIEELSLKQWEFLQKTTTLTLTANTADYTLPSDFKKVMSLRLVTNAMPLSYTRQRSYDKATATQTTSTPTHYTLFPGTAATGASPQHSVQTIRFIPTPAAANTATLKYYRQMAIIDDDGDTLDLPRRYQYWPIYQAKATILADHNGADSRIQYWKGKADRLMAQMVADDQEEPDELVGFESARDQIGPYDLTHPYAALYALDGF